ncbi:hypothetical protein BpHYR1_030150, partial [Brachionus plicatilis]
LKGYKLCIIPEEAKTISIGQKRKKGGPKKQKAALLYELALLCINEQFRK